MQKYTVSNLKNKLINNDVLKEIKKFPDDFIDLTITSPPYNKGEKNKGWLVSSVKYKRNSDSINEIEYQNNQINVLNEIYRITKPGGSLFYNHKIRWVRGKLIHPLEWLLKTKWNLRQEIIWNRKIAANIRGWRFWQIDERIYWLYKPKDNNLIGTELKSKHALLTSIWDILPERKNIHPAPFPIELPSRIIYSMLDDKKGIIFDPYVGSGTTIIAAKYFKHNYIGIDIAKEYINQTKKRLINHKIDYERIDKELIKHTVQKTFKQRKEEGMYKNRL